MLRLLVALMMTIACASAEELLVEKEPPPYSESRVASEESFEHVFKYLGTPIATEKQEKFVIFTLGIDTVARAIANGQNYEQAFSNVDIAVKLGEIAPDAARNVVLKSVNKVLEMESPMKNLIDELCYPGSFVGTVGRECDAAVDTAVLESPWYKPHAEILNGTGTFSSLFKEIQPDLEKATEDMDMLKYLESNKYVLEPMITVISKLISLEKKIKGVLAT